MSRRPPKRSYKSLGKGRPRPLTSAPMAAASEMAPRFQPNSSLMGRTKTPKPLRAPIDTRAIQKVVATMHQP